MDLPIALLSNQYYATAVTTSSQQVVLTPEDISKTRVIVDNSLGATGVFVTSSSATGTAVYPASLTVPSQGKVVGAGSIQTYEKNPNHGFIQLIRSSGSADVAVTVGSGD